MSTPEPEEKSNRTPPILETLEASSPERLEAERLALAWHSDLHAILWQLAAVFRMADQSHKREAADVLIELARDVCAGEADALGISAAIGMEIACRRGGPRVYAPLADHFDAAGYMPGVRTAYGEIAEASINARRVWGVEHG